MRLAPGWPAPGVKTHGEAMTIGKKAATWLCLASILLALALLLLPQWLFAPTAAKAEPAQITRAKQEAEELRRLIDSTAAELEQVIEAYNGAKVKLAAIEAALQENQSKLTQAEEDLKIASERLSERLAAIYKERNLSFLEVLLSAESLTDLINRFDLLMRIGRNDSQILEQVTAYRNKVKETKERLAKARKDQAALVEEMKATKATIEAKLAERQRLLQGKEREIAQLEREEAERQARLAEQARQAARLAAERAAAARAYQRPATTSSQGSSNGGSTSNAPAPRSDLPPSSIGARVVEIAMQYLGVPYVWAGESPSGFDCSGLVTYVFRQVGINLPHYAAWQFQYGQPVARDALQPGDLVFFGSNIHHVGIYVGDGNMIHAPYTGAVVRINSIDRSDYAGARRIYP